MSQVSTDRLDASWTETLARVRAFVAARVGDDELAADITQDVVVRSIASGALDRVDNPAAWLYRSARNAVIDHYRTRRRHDPLDDTDRWPDLGPTDNLPNEATRELARCLQPLLHQLPPAAHDALDPGRRRRPDPPAGRHPARHLRVRHEVPGAAGPSPAQGPPRAVLRRRGRPRRCRRRLPPGGDHLWLRHGDTLLGIVTRSSVAGTCRWPDATFDVELSSRRRRRRQVGSYVGCVATALLQTAHHPRRRCWPSPPDYRGGDWVCDQPVRLMSSGSCGPPVPGWRRWKSRSARLPR